MESPSATTGGLREELRSDAQTLTGSAAQRIHSEVNARKGDAADQAKSISTALDKAADGLGENGPTWLKSAIQQAAQKVQQLADGIEHKDSRQLTRDVQQLARQNPGTFLATCALAGFAAARVFKAGESDDSMSNYGSGNYGSSGYGSGELGTVPHPATAFSGGSEPYATAPKVPQPGGMQ